MAEQPFSDSLYSRCETSKLRERIAWAAGFYEGEGGTYCTINKDKSRRSPHRYLQLNVTQADDEMLTRFQNIFKVGKVHNCGENKYGTEIFRFSTARFEHVQFIIACMWP